MICADAILQFAICRNRKGSGGTPAQPLLNNESFNHLRNNATNDCQFAVASSDKILTFFHGQF